MSETTEKIGKVARAASRFFSGAVSRGFEHIPCGAGKGSVSSPIAHSVLEKTQHSTGVMGNEPAAYSHDFQTAVIQATASMKSIRSDFLPTSMFFESWSPK